jgi:hypothetical protein
MGIAQVAGQSEIVAQVKTVEGLDVYEGPYISDGAVPTKADNGMFIPYATVDFGSSYQGSERGIVGSRYNTLLTNVTVHVVSPDDRLSREFQDAVRDKLIDFTPVESSPLTVQGGFNFADTDLGYTRFVYSTTFRYQTNMSY